MPARLSSSLGEAGELEEAEAVLAEGSQLAAAAGAAALAARMGIVLTEIRNSHGGPEDRALAECQAAAAVLEAEGDLEGLAEAWAMTGRIRFWLGDSSVGQQALERAIADARQGRHRPVQMQPSFWLAATFMLLPIPADTAIARAEPPLQTADGEPWAKTTS